MKLRRLYKPSAESCITSGINENKTKSCTRGSGMQFCVNQSSVLRIINYWIPMLAMVLSDLIQWH